MDSEKYWLYSIGVMQMNLESERERMRMTTSQSSQWRTRMSFDVSL